MTTPTPQPPTIGERAAYAGRFGVGALLDEDQVIWIRTSSVNVWANVRENAARIDAIVSAHVAAKDAEIERLRSVLRDLEWAKPSHGEGEDYYCAFCMAIEGELHVAGCPMGEAMGAINKRSEP